MMGTSLPQEVTYRAVLETCPDGFLLTTPAGAILDANPAACRILGRSKPELLRLNRQQLVDWTDPACHEALREWLATGTYSGQVRWIHADGSRLPIEVATSLFVGLDGREMAGIFFRARPDRPRAGGGPRPAIDVVDAAGAAGDPVFVQDEAGCIVAANDAAIDLFGIPNLRPSVPLTEILGVHALWDRAGQDFPVSRLPGYRALNGERYPEDVVGLGPHVGGHDRWLHVRAGLLPVTAHGDRLAATVGRDITDVLDAERLRQRREIREARFDGVVLAARELAHRLNNSLTLAVGSLDLVQLQGGLTADSDDLIAQAQLGLENAVRDIRKFQRINRVETRETPAGPALDLDRSSEAS